MEKSVTSSQTRPDEQLVMALKLFLFLSNHIPKIWVTPENNGSGPGAYFNIILAQI